LNYGDTLIISKEIYHNNNWNNLNEKLISITDFNYKEKLTDDQYRKVQGNGFCDGRFYEIGSSIDLDDVVELVSAPFSENYPLEQGHKDCADTVFDDPPYSENDRLDGFTYRAVYRKKRKSFYPESEFPDSFLILLAQDPSTVDKDYSSRHYFNLGYFFDFNINLNSEILLLEFDDQRNIEELSKITGYSLKPNG
jgi:hypothetical protein